MYHSALHVHLCCVHARPSVDGCGTCVPSLHSPLPLLSLPHSPPTPGGHDGNGLLNSLERYDPISNTWTTVASMSSHRSVGRLVALKGCLYAIGGYDGNNIITNVERCVCGVC